jgi:23S rRNA (uracil1939-C5)-methyltransferase
MTRSSAPPSRTAQSRIEELAPGGDGVAHVSVDGVRRAVFVPGAAVGDEVRLSMDVSRRPARGRILELIHGGPERVEPACAYVQRCGGCDWMHVSLAGQLAAHIAQLRRAVPRAWESFPVVPHPALEALGYRTRARLHVRASGGRAIVGMHEAGTRDPVEVSSCVVLHPTLDRARISLGALLEGAHGTGEVQVALGGISSIQKDAPTEPCPVLELRWRGTLATAFFTRLEQAVLAGTWCGGRIFVGDVARPATVGDPTPWMLGADEEPLRLAPGRFAQASERYNRRLGARVAELAHAAAGERAHTVELFAGAGNFTVLLARRSAKVLAVESDRASCDAARANLAARGLAAKVVEADAGNYEPSPATTLLVLDPPRTGARATAERLTRSPIRHVLYVSCDAQTLARDLAVLEPYYLPRAIESFAMFPQTSHAETVVLLERRGRRPASSKELP